MSDSSDELILLLGKGPHSEGRLFQKASEETWIGRFFPRFYQRLQYQWQNWYQSTELAAEVAERTDAEVLILTAVNTGKQPARFYHQKLLRGFGIEPRVEPKVYETIGEIEAGFEIAKEEDKKLHLIISDVEHYIRIRWLVWYGRRHRLLPDVPVEYHWTLGIPRMNQILTGIPGIFITVLADLLGKREELKEYFINRRKSGKQ